MATSATQATPGPMPSDAESASRPFAGVRPTVWGQDKLQQKYPTLEGRIEADVAVVGGGIGGLCVAYNLVRRGLKVVVLEKNAIGGLCVAYNLVRRGLKVVVLEKNVIGSGQTGKTTAHLMAWNDDYYSVLEKEFGKTEAALVGQSHREAIDWVEKTEAEEGISCNFSRLPGYLVPHDDTLGTRQKVEKEMEASKRAGFEVVRMVQCEPQGQVETEMEASKRAGFEDVRLVQCEPQRRLETLGADFPYALCFPSTADFHPLMFLHGLADAIVRRGGQIFERTPVFRHKGTVVSTKDGSASVEAQGAVVLATNSPLNHNLLVHARQEANRTYVVCLKLPKGSLSKANWWSTHTPYHYVRIAEEERYDVLVVGGEDHRVGMRPRSYYDAWGRLESWARVRWPQAQELLTKWSGMVYEPIDILGLYGRNPADSTHTYIVTGDSGQGMTGGAIAGILLPSLICGEYHPWTRLYSPSRAPALSKETLTGVAGVTINTAQGYGGHVPLLDADPVAIEDLKPGCGAVLQLGLHKAAVYRDEQGGVHKRSAVCPHMKCIVSWNPNDKTFDCPCHGSLFSRFGECFNGPAKADLFPLEGGGGKGA